MVKMSPICWFLTVTDELERQLDSYFLPIFLCLKATDPGSLSPSDFQLLPSSISSLAGFLLGMRSSSALSLL